MTNTYEINPHTSSKSNLPGFLPKAPPRSLIHSNELYSGQDYGSGKTLREVALHHPSQRSKIRMCSVGLTNRWRYSQRLGGDFLGLSQAFKSVALTKSPTLRNLQTGDSPHITNVVPHNQQRSADDYDVLTRAQSVLNKGENHQLLGTIEPVVTSSSRLRKPKSSSTISSRSWLIDPVQLFQMFTRLVTSQHEPDVKLYCLGHEWQLHRAYMTKSKVLSHLLRNATLSEKPKVYHDAVAEKLDEFVTVTDAYSSNYKEVTRRLSSKELEKEFKADRKSKKSRSVLKIKLNISDPWVTEHAFAVALGHLYLEESIVSSRDAISALAAASCLQFNSLISSCCRVMICGLASNTVCHCLEAANRYRQEALQLACEKWLELNFVPQLSSTTYIRDLSTEALNKILQSSRLFTFNEYSLYKALCIWLFMKIHPNTKYYPSLPAVMNYFGSMSRTCSFLEKEDGIQYSATFNCLRLHGITDTKHIEDIKHMNIIPRSWILKVLSHHYHALQGGGDMSHLLNFSVGANRYGFILKQEPGYYSEIISLHGFHFEAKAQRRGNENSYIVYIQRLRPTDPSLSMRACNRATFSIRHDRIVRYQLDVHYTSAKDSLQWKHASTGILEQSLGLDHESAQSEILNVIDAGTPLYVSFSLFFPPS